MGSLFVNSLATPLQLASSPSQSDGISQDLEASLRFGGCALIQSAGILLRLPQTTIATAIVLFQRFYLVSSMREHPITPTVSASLFLSSKLTEQPRKPRDIINVLTFVLSVPTPCPISPPKPEGTQEKPDPETYYVPESTYFAQRTHLLHLETHILRALSFQTHVSLPYTLAINYLQALDALKSNPTIVERTFGYLTDALLSPSLLYVTHQPNALAVAAIYLAARECGAKMPDTSVVPGGGGGEGGWWEVFDVEREELGFLVVCLKAVSEWVVKEVEKWKGKWGKLLMVGEDGGPEGLEKELEGRRKGEE